MSDELQAGPKLDKKLANLTNICAGVNCSSIIGKGAEYCALCTIKREKNRKDTLRKLAQRQAAREQGVNALPKRKCSTENCANPIRTDNKSGLCQKCAAQAYDYARKERNAAAMRTKRADAKAAGLPNPYPAATSRRCGCGTAIRVDNKSGLCTACLKSARDAEYQRRSREKKHIAGRNNLATTRSTAPIAETKKPVQHAFFVQSAPSAPKQVKVSTPASDTAQTGQNTGTGEPVAAVKPTAAQAKAERDCLTGLASYAHAVKDGQARFGGSAYELHATPDQKHYTAQKRNTEPKAGYRAVKWFYKDGMGRWQEAAIPGQRKTEEESDE